MSAAPSTLTRTISRASLLRPLPSARLLGAVQKWWWLWNCTTCSSSSREPSTTTAACLCTLTTAGEGSWQTALRDGFLSTVGFILMGLGMGFRGCALVCPVVCATRQDRLPLHLGRRHGAPSCCNSPGGTFRCLPCSHRHFPPDCKCDGPQPVTRRTRQQPRRGHRIVLQPA